MTIRACLFGLVWIGSLALAHAAERPNLVIFLADDAGWGDYSHSGNRMVSTPQIDSIANSGVSIDRFFVCPACAPTRAEMLTGRYYLRGGVRGVSTGQERLDPSEKTLADAFQAAGYATGAFGKWHNGTQWPYHPLARGFDEFFGYTSGHWGEYFDAPLEENGRMIRSSGYIVDVCTDRALQFIDRHHDRPFLCYIPFTTPHSPWSVPDDYWAKFKDQPLLQVGLDQEGDAANQTRCALAMMENQDWNVGRVLSKLDELKLSDNTIVLYFSDNGPNNPRWNGGMKGIKGGTDEGSVRSVCYLRWPGRLPQGHVVSQICGAIDLLPTLTSLAGISRVGDQPLDGCDLSPLLRKQDVEWPDRMIFTTWQGSVSVRTQQYRLDQKGELFDMQAHPGQTTPVTDRQPEMAKKLSDAVKAWRQEMYGNRALEKKPVPTPAASTPGKVQRMNPVDPRPLTVGYREFPITTLPARDGEPQGGIERSGAAPNCSYFVNWTKIADQMVWKIDVHTTGRYRVIADYTCKIGDEGSTIELTCGRGRLIGKVTPAWDPPLKTGQDRVPRTYGESQMKEFHPLDLGIIELEQGVVSLTLRSTDIPGRSVMDLFQLTLILLPADAPH